MGNLPEFLLKKHSWMNYGQAMALVVDAYERYKDQSKYQPKNVQTLIIFLLVSMLEMRRSAGIS